MTTHDAITQYVVFRQAAGADFRPTARLLGAFCRAVGPHVPLAEIPVEGVRAFVDGHGPVTRYWHRAHFGHRDQSDRSIVITPIGGSRSERSDAGRLAV